MPLIASYDSSDAYINQEYYDSLEPENQDYFEVGDYDENMDECYYSNFKYEVKQAFAKRKFPLVLEALNSDWRGRTGYKECNDVDEVISSVASFDGSYMQLYRTTGSKLYFMTASHDCPTSFRINVNPM